MSSKTSEVSKHASQWIMPSFDDDFSNPDVKLKLSGKKLKKRSSWDAKEKSQIDLPSKITKTKQHSNEKSSPWLEKHQPTTESSLAVHKKKVQEVKDWLTDQFQGKSKKGVNTLLLTGPSGCGKTATISALCNDLSIKVKDWVNPVSQEPTEAFDPRDESTHAGPSQTKQFSDFLLRANRYSGVVTEGKSSVASSVCGSLKSIVLVEDLPNAFYHNPTKLHGVLRQCHTRCRNPIVFIASDGYSGDTSVNKLFPKNLQYELGVTCISFNAVAPTSLNKAMAKILEIEQKEGNIQGSVPKKNTLDLIASSCHGDVRACINSLEFSFCTERSNESIDLSELNFGKKARRTKMPKLQSKLSGNKNTDSEVTGVVASRDSSLFLFRALGKILNSKRDALTKDNKLMLNRPELDRGMLHFNPEDVIERCHVSSDMMNLYLHENYPDFFTSIDDIMKASNYLCEADVINGQWNVRQQIADYTSLIAARGIIFSNCNSSISAWRPLHKSRWYGIANEMNDNFNSGAHLLEDFHYSGKALFTEVIPFLSKVDVPMKFPGQISFLQMMGQFSRKQYQAKSRGERLQEKESDDFGNSNIPVVRLATDELPPNSQTSTSSFAERSLIVEDDIIEDFNDSDDEG